MDLMTWILIAVVVLGWRLRRDNAKRNELLEQISRQRTPRRQSLRLQGKQKLVVKKPKTKVVFVKHKIKH